MPPTPNDDRRDRRRLKRKFDKLDAYSSVNEQDEQQAHTPSKRGQFLWRGDDGYNTKELISNAANEPVYEIYSQHNQHRKEFRRSRGDGLKENFEQLQKQTMDARKSSASRFISADDEIEGKEFEATKQVDMLLQATKQLLTRRINFVPSKRKYATAQNIPNLVPLNPEKTVFEYRVKGTQQKEDEDDDEEEKPTPKKKNAKSKQQQLDSDEEDEKPTNNKKKAQAAATKSKKNAKKAAAEDDDESDDNDDEEAADSSPDDGEREEQPPAKKQKTSAAQNDVYVDEDRSFLEPPYQLYPIDKVIANINWKKVTRVGGGLMNLGNTCFMNAALQCLLYTPPLVNYLLDKLGSAPMVSSAKFNAIDEMAKLAKKVLEGKTVSPDKIAHNLRAIGKFRLGRQEDSHEFLLGILDRMESVILGQYEDKLDKRVSKTNIINQIFGGYYRSQVKSLQSSYVSNTYDPFVDVSVTISQNNTLEKALARETATESLDGDNKYKCPITRKYVKALKRLTLHRAPPALIIHLKRFDIFGKKINKHIQYPEKLDLRPFMSNTDQEAQYNLYAVLVHSGSTCHSGHYYSYIKASNNIWYCMDDSRVSQVSIKAVLSQKAYILFYLREYPNGKQPPMTPLPKAAFLKTPTSFLPPTLVGKNGEPVSPFPTKSAGLSTPTSANKNNKRKDREEEDEEEEDETKTSDKMDRIKDADDEDDEDDEPFKVTAELLAKASPNKKRKVMQAAEKAIVAVAASTPTKAKQPALPSTPTPSKQQQQQQQELSTPTTKQPSSSQKEPSTPITPGRNCELSDAKLLKFKSQLKAKREGAVLGTPLTPGRAAKAQMLKEMDKAMTKSPALSVTIPGNEDDDDKEIANLMSSTIASGASTSTPSSMSKTKPQRNVTPKSPKSPKIIVPPLDIKSEVQPENAAKLVAAELVKTPTKSPAPGKQQLNNGFAKPQTPVMASKESKSMNAPAPRSMSAPSSAKASNTVTTPVKQQPQLNGNSTSQLSHPREGTPIVMKFDPYRHLNNALGNQFNEDLDTWDSSTKEEQTRVLKQMAVDKITQNAKSEWDRFVDAGKTKKIRNKDNLALEAEMWNSNTNPFQRVANNRKQTK